MEVFQYLTPPQSGLELDLFPDQVAGYPDKTIGVALTLSDIVRRGIEHFSQSLYCRNCLPSCSSPEHINPLFLDLRIGNIRQDQLNETVEGLLGRKVRYVTVSSHPDDLKKLTGNAQFRRSGIKVLSAITPRFLRNLELRHEDSDDLMEQVDHAFRTPVAMGCDGILVPPRFVKTARELLPDNDIATVLSDLKKDVNEANHVIYPRGYSIPRANKSAHNGGQ